MKFLYNDGSGKIRQIASKEELDYYLGLSPDKNRVRIWLFHSSSWITYSEYVKTATGNRQLAMENGKARKEEEIVKAVKVEPVVSPFVPTANSSTVKEKKLRPPTVTKPLQIILNICIVLVVAGGVYAALFYNKPEWTVAKIFETAAPRPENAPALDVDSLIQSVEVKEMRTLDKLTKMNLRLRNNWPDKIVCTLQGLREKQLKKDSITRFTKLECIVKNFTGYQIDEAIVAVEVWKDGEIKQTEAFTITGIGYRDPTTQKIPNTYQGDSLTVKINSLRSFGLNFCYSYDKPTISGNPNDKWFCKD